MCGRVRLSSDVSEIKLVFSIPPHRPTPNIAPNWNVAPTDPLPVVRYDPKAHERSLDVMRWGLVPFWAKDLKVGFSNINAKAEGNRRETCLPRGIPAAALPRTRRKLLRVEEDCVREAALCHRAGRPRADGSRRTVGKLAFAGGRVGAQLRCHHGDTKRAVRRTPRPNAGGPGASGLAGVVGRGPSRPSPSKGPARSLSRGGDDLLAGEYSGWQCQEQRPELD
jgi:SOS response associated peptidase (SRAP)